MENKETITDFEKMKDQMLKLATDTMQNGRINVNERKAIIRYIDEINRKIPDDSNKNLEISEMYLNQVLLSYLISSMIEWNYNMICV